MAKKLLQSLLEVNRLYDPDGQPVLFDLQVEAEILGCDLALGGGSPTLRLQLIPWPERITKNSPPALPNPVDGRLPMILDVMRKMKIGSR